MQNIEYCKVKNITICIYEYKKYINFIGKYLGVNTLQNSDIIWPGDTYMKFYPI